MIKRLACLVVAVAISATGMLITPTSAGADVINQSCGPNINPQNDTTAPSPVSVQLVPISNGSTLDLRIGWDPSYLRWVFWARISGNVDEYGMDWSDDSGNSWHWCPWPAGPNYTLAVDQWGSRVFRAAAKVNGTWYH